MEALHCLPQFVVTATAARFEQGVLRTVPVHQWGMLQMCALHCLSRHVTAARANVVQGVLRAAALQQ